MKSRLLGGLALLCAGASAFAYDVETHRAITFQAVSLSNLATRLPDLGLAKLTDGLPNNTIALGGPVFCVDPPTIPFLTDGKRSITELVTLGAFCEDSTLGTGSTARYLFHFYDPAYAGIGLAGFLSSQAWGLEKSDIATQQFSYSDAKTFLFNAITQPAQSDRDTSMSMVFRSLGHTMHLVEDLAQPQHTRSDSHGSGSLYEKYTDSIRFDLPFFGYPAVQVTNPDAFWHTSDNKGLADYSNRGFVTAGTNFRGTSTNILPSARYALPDSTGAVVIKKQITDADMLGPVGPNQNLIGEIHFISTPVQDAYAGTSTVNPRTSSFSIFDEDLKTMGADMVFSLNRFTFLEAHKLLIPRAVGYATGVLNYFFRGQMAITLPNQGYYAAVDHTSAAGNDATSGGFSTIKLKIRNTTPGPNNTIEPMMGSGTVGSLYAVVKFHRNKCYKADLSGEYGAQDPDGNPINTVAACWNKDEEVAVSNRIDAPANIDSATPQEVTFTFPAGKPVPISGTDMILQVVYDGPLGQEARAVVVATKDISEPTYLYSWDDHDQFKYAHYPFLSVNGGGMIYTWTEWCQQAITAGDVTSQDECNARLWPTKRGYQFSSTDAPIPGWDPATSTVPQGEWLDISQQQPPILPQFNLFYPTGSYSRVAVLADANPTNPVVVDSDWNGVANQQTVHEFMWYGGTLIAAKMQKDPTTGTLTPTQHWAQSSRGIWVDPADVPWMANPSVPVGPLQPSAVQFGTGP